MKFRVPIFVLAFLIFFLTFSETFSQPIDLKNRSEQWADSVLNTLSLNDKIEQLFTIKVFPNGNKANFNEINDLICNYKVGGICFFKGNPTVQVNWLNYWQQYATVPILVSIDGEWGVSMRYDSTIVYPRQLTLGAIQNDSLIYQMGEAIGKECKRLGIHVNFAPVADINSNPNNPVIGSRSFGENKIQVAEKASLYMAAMQNQGIIACAKHFPGHGDTDTDSHQELPQINHSAETIDTLDLYPFKKLFSEGLKSVMVAHLNIPALDTAKGSVSSLSGNIVTGLLKEKLNFKGLVFSDALDMKGVSSANKPGEAEIKALLAGIDMLILPQDLSKAIDSIRKAVETKKIPQELIDQKCLKILKYKYDAGLYSISSISTNHLYKDLNAPENKFLQYQLYEKAITLVKSSDSILPLPVGISKTYAVLSVGDSLETSFQRMILNYTPAALFNISKNIDKKTSDSLITELSKYNKIILGIHNTNSLANQQFGVNNQTVELIDSLLKTKKIILNIFGSPYIIARLENTSNIQALMVSYQDNEITESLSAQMLFGAIGTEGKLPVTASSEFALNTGIETRLSGKLKYTLPEELGIASDDLAKIDSLALNGISAKAYPGCQILLVKDGKVFLHKTYGYLTYDNKVPVASDMIYDMASITKIAATTLAVMKLYDEGKIDLDKKLGYYLPQLDGSNKNHLIIRNVLTHQAKLKAWIPFFKKTIINGVPDTAIYKKVKSINYAYRVADSMFIRNDYRDTIINEVIQSPLSKKKGYVYSDLGFYLMRMLVEEVTGQELETYLKENFYTPLGLSTIGYKPRERFSLKRIVPTEIDTVFRHQLVYGDVNDQGAAMLGGISGHAGLFSDANDLAVILQMLLQKGEYAGKRYLKASTIEEFTKYQFPEKNNRRGLGFDKPSIDPKENGPTCPDASVQSYGHSGFTGTFFWSDPKENLIFIFLSNRVYPDAGNRKLIDMNIRTSIQQVVYDALKKSKIKKNNFVNIWLLQKLRIQ
jgi:beta-N-acetylhexosaminidase